MPANLNLLNEILSELLVCACETLDQGICDEPGSLCGCPCRAYVSASEPAWDDCCEGQLTVHAERIFAFGNFPSQASGVNLCQTPLAVEAVVTLLRCAPTVKNDGSPPTHLELQASADDIHRDLYLLTRGLLCCLHSHGRMRKFVFNGGRIVGPQGGCVGVEIRFTIEILDV